MNPFARQVFRLSRWTPWLARGLFRLRMRPFHRDPETFLSQLINRWSSSDQKLFERPEIRGFFLNDLREVLVHGQGVRGLIQELRLYQNWGFGIQDVAARAKVVIWHGRQDVLVPMTMSTALTKHFPEAKVNLVRGGHFVILEHFDELIQQMRSAVE
jgi:surfactin synthase thioesterase subunit